MKKLALLATFLALPGLCLGQSRLFDGSTDYLSSSTPSGMNDHTATLACWVRYDTVGAENFFSFGDLSTTNDFIAIGVYTFGGNVQAQHFTRAGGGTPDTSFTTATTDDTAAWWLILGQWASATSRAVQIIKESSPLSGFSGSDSTSIGTFGSFTGAVIGGPAWSAGKAQFTGDICYCAAWSSNFGLTGSINGRNNAMALGFTPTLIEPDKSAGIWTMNQAGGTDSAQDVSVNSNSMSATGNIGQTADGPRPIFWPSGGN